MSDRLTSRKVLFAGILAAVLSAHAVAQSQPPVPGFVAATRGTHAGGVRIWWEDVPGAEAFDIWRSAFPDKQQADYLASVGGSKREYIDSSIPANTSYYYWVRTVIGKVASDFGYYHEGYWLPGPAAPTNVQATDGTLLNRVRITWSATTGATGYQLWRSLTDDRETSVLHATTSETAYLDETVDPSLTYYYWVKAVNADGVSGFSWSNPGHALPAPPEQVGNVQATDGASLDVVSVTWDATPGMAQYEVWRSSSSELWTSERIAESVTHTTYVDSNAVPMQVYTYWVRAVNSIGYGAFSVGDSGYRELGLPEKASHVNASQGMYAGRTRVTWEAAERASSYEVLRNVVRDIPSATVIASVVANPGLNEYWDTGGQGATVYFYWIRSVNNAGAGPVSWSTTGFWNPGPAAPTNIQATDGTLPSAIRVTWTASSGAFLYEVWRNVIQDKQGAVLVGTPLQASFLDSAVVPGQMYTYWVKAVGSAGTSGFSWSNDGYAEGPVPIVRTFSLETANAVAGQSVSLPVTLQARGDENSVSFSLQFDPALLAFRGLVSGSGLPAGTLFVERAEDAASGRIGVMLALPPGTSLVEGSAEIAQIEVEVLPEAVHRLAGIEFADQPTPREVASPVPESLQATWVGGGVQVSALAFAGFEADVSPLPDGDGAATLLDWVQVGRFMAGLDPVPGGTLFQRADCAPRNTLGDGFINLQDWVQAGRYVQGLDPLTESGGPSSPASVGGLSILEGGARVRSGATGAPVGVREALGQPAVSVASGSLEDSPHAPVLLHSDGNLNALSFTVSFDAAELEYQGATPGPEIQQAGGLFMLDDRQAGVGRIGVAVAMPPGRSLPAGLRKVVDLRFAAVHPEAVGDHVVALTDDRMSRSASTPAAEPVDAVYESGILTVGRAAGGGDGSTEEPPPTLNLAVNEPRTPGTFAFTWSSRAGRTYRVEESYDLVEWHSLDRVTGQENVTAFFREEDEKPTVFLRVVEEMR